VGIRGTRLDVHGPHEGICWFNINPRKLLHHAAFFSRQKVEHMEISNYDEKFRRLRLGPILSLFWGAEAISAIFGDLYGAPPYKYLYGAPA
jgi:hypothetical protein